jgi:hypothetical protein
VFSGQTVTSTYDLKGYGVEVSDGSGRPIKIDSTGNEGKGSITVTISLISSFYAQTGPIMKHAATMLGIMKRGNDGYKRRFLMLLPTAMMYFDDEFTLEAPRNTLLPTDVESIVEVPTKPGHHPEIKVTAHNSKESWQLTWVDGATQDMKDLWMHKFKRFVSDEHQRRSLSRSASAASIVRHGSNVSLGATATTPKKSKRTSVFGF